MEIADKPSPVPKRAGLYFCSKTKIISFPFTMYEIL